MLKTGCVNPEVIAALAKCGHGDQVVIGSGNFPLESQVNPDAKRIYLNISGGVPTSTEILKALISLINVEAAGVIAPADETMEVEAFKDYQEVLGLELVKYGRDDFYAACKKPTVRVAIESADQRAFSNVLLTVGVVRG